MAMFNRPALRAVGAALLAATVFPGEPVAQHADSTAPSWAGAPADIDGEIAAMRRARRVLAAEIKAFEELLKARESGAPLPQVERDSADDGRLRSANDPLRTTRDVVDIEGEISRFRELRRQLADDVANLNRDLTKAIAAGKQRSANDRAELDDRARRIERLQARVADAEQSRSLIEDARDALEKRVASLRTEVEAAVAERDGARQSLIEAKELTGVAAVEGDKLRARVDSLDKEISQRKKAQMAMQARIDAIAGELAEAHQTAEGLRAERASSGARMEKLFAELVAANRERRQMQKQLAASHSRVEQLSRLQAQGTAERETLERTASTVREQNQALNRQLEARSNDLESVSAERDAQRAQVDDLSRQLAALHQRMDALESERARLKHERDEHQSARQRQSDRVSELEAQANQWSAERETLERMASAAREQKEALARQLETRASELESVSAERDSQRAQVGDLSRQLAGLHQQMAQLESERARLERERDEHQSAGRRASDRVSELEAQSNKWAAEREAAKQAQQRAAFEQALLESRIDALEKTKRELTSSLDEAGTLIARITEKNQALGARLDSLAAQERAPEEAPTPVQKRAARTHVIQPGDSLSALAARYLGDPGRWREIHEANRKQIPNPNVIEVGTELVIPPASPP